MTTKTHTIECRFQDGKSLEFDCREDQTIVQGGLDNGVILLAQCMRGNCATCKCLSTDDDSDYDFADYVNNVSLPPEDEEEGYILGCGTFPFTDMVLEMPYEYERVSFGAVIPAESFNTKIVVADLISSNVFRLLLQVTDKEGNPQAIKFLAGQYMTLFIPGTETGRSYSMATTPDQNGQLEFLIRILPDGKFSDFLVNDAKVGQELIARGPYGIFNLRKHSKRTRFFIAGGTGVAPFFSMIRQIAADGDTIPTYLFFGMNKQSEVFTEGYLEERDRIEKAHPNIHIRQTVMEADTDWMEEIGSVIDSAKKAATELDAMPDVYLCGPPGMMDAARETAKSYEEILSGEYEVIQEDFQASGE